MKNACRIMTVCFAKNGLALKDNTWQVYLRHQYKHLNAKHINSYLPTGEFLTLSYRRFIVIATLRQNVLRSDAN